MQLKIWLTYETLLRCEVSTTVLCIDHHDDRGERVIGKIVDTFHQNGERYMKDHLPKEKQACWWDTVLRIKENFNWDLYQQDKGCPSTIDLPRVKPYNKTLEFQSGCHRALAIALLGSKWYSQQIKPMEVVLDQGDRPKHAHEQ